MQLNFSKRLFPVLCLAASYALSANASEMTQTQKESYGIGFSTGTYIANQLVKQEKLGVKFDANSVLEGFMDAFKKEQKLKDEDIISLLNERDEKLNKLSEAAQKQVLETNLKNGKEFMAKNAKSKKVKTTKSGLQYEVLALGDGDKPKRESVIVANYKAYLIDGTVFDDTYGKKTPAHLSMINLIDGLQEGLLLMNGGSKYKFVIPPELGYGDEEMEHIPAGSTLVFEFELIKALKPGELANAAKQLHETEPRLFHGGHGSSVSR